MNDLTKIFRMCIIYFVGSLPYASIAQLVEHFTRNEGVEGSSPFRSLLKRNDSIGSEHFQSLNRFFFKLFCQ